MSAARTPLDLGDGRLPAATTDLEQAKRDFTEFGYCLVKDCLTPPQVSAIRARMLEQAAAELRVLGREQPVLQGLRMLPNKGAVFHDLILQPQVTEIMKHGFDGLPFNLSTLSGIITREGSPAQIIHNDQSFLPDPPPRAWVNNVLYMISDFSEENGGTRVIPRSQFWAPPKFEVREGQAVGEDVETIAIEGDAGTAFIFDGRLWHGGGASRVPGPRLAISGYYCVPCLRQAENFTASLHEDVYETFSHEVRAMLGFNRASGLNHIEPMREGGRANDEMPTPYLPEMRV